VGSTGTCMACECSDGPVDTCSYSFSTHASSHVDSKVEDCDTEPVSDTEAEVPDINAQDTDTDAQDVKTKVCFQP